MQISTAAPAAKRARVKASEEPAKLPATTRKPRVRKASKATAASSEVAVPEVRVESCAMQAADEDLSGLIATTAYFLAAERNFSAGHELDDWLEAERRVRSARLVNAN
ncbi:MAG TPA: DUF2934 domain-containing protein [Steroidobacteraceae bacterium]